MLNPSPDYSQSRPFKIFISLLDKYEIGLPLTEVLVYDAFKCLQQLLQSGQDAGDDVRKPAYVLRAGLLLMWITYLAFDDR